MIPWSPRSGTAQLLWSYSIKKKTSTRSSSHITLPTSTSLRRFHRGNEDGGTSDDLCDTSPPVSSMTGAGAAAASTGTTVRFPVISDDHPGMLARCACWRSGLFFLSVPWIRSRSLHARKPFSVRNSCLPIGCKTSQYHSCGDQSV